MVSLDSHIFDKPVASDARSLFAHRPLSCTAVLVALLALTTVSRAETPKASIELFTSQGCSSCPAADKLIGELGQDHSLVTMSLPVDLWDYLGWKDTLALKGHSKRQKAYVHMQNDQVYTPQAVVNGMMLVPGSDRAAIEQAIEQTDRETAVMRLPVKLTINGDKLTVEVSASTDGTGQGEVWLLPLIKKIPVAIERGENRGHTVTYNNVVRSWVKLGEWVGQAETYSLSIKDFQNSDFDSIVVLVQKGDPQTPGLMLGASSAALR